MSPFVLFGIHHLVALCLVALASLAAYRCGSGKHSDKLNTAGGVLLLLYGLGLWSYKLKDGFHRLDDLPFQLCDVTYILCILCFFSPRPVLVTLVTYWGLGGTLQALITPDIKHGFPSTEFIVFFSGHSIIVLTVAFLLGRHAHPGLAGFRGLKTAFSGLLLYTLVAGSLDFLCDLNYGYIREKPKAASVLDYLGPWPIYVFATLGIAFGIFAVLSVALKFLPPAKVGGESRSSGESFSGEANR